MSQSRRTTSGLTTAPSPPAIGEVGPPVGRCGFTRRICQVDRLERCRHQQAVIGLDETANRVHVPGVILVGVHRAFRGHHVKRRDADIAKRFDRPAVVPVRLREPVGEILPELVTLEERSHINPAPNRALERRNSRSQPNACGGSDRRILLPHELQRLCRPGHQLAIETHPVRVQPLPESAPVQGSCELRRAARVPARDHRRIADPCACNRFRPRPRGSRIVRERRPDFGRRSEWRGSPCASARRRRSKRRWRGSTRTLPPDAPAVHQPCSSHSGTSSAAGKSATSDLPRTGSSPPMPRRRSPRES